MKTITIAFLLAALAFALVLPTESGDTFYFVYGGKAGAANSYGEVLWSVPGDLIASNAMGSCLAVARTLTNGTTFLGTEVVLYTADGRQLWAAVVKFNATALATDCVNVAIGGIDGSLAVLKDGKIVYQEKRDKPIFALAYARDGQLLVGVGDPVSGFTTYVDRCGNTITAVKTDAPYLVVNGVWYRGGLAPMLKPPASASQDCRSFVFGVYDTLYNGTRQIYRAPSPILAVAVSGNGRVVAAATADRIYVLYKGRVAAEIPLRSIPRSIALSWDGLSMAYETDSGVSVMRMAVATLEPSGCPIPVKARVVSSTGSFEYVLSGPTDVLVPAGGGLVELYTVYGDGFRCVPLENLTVAPRLVLQYRVEYKVDVCPLARGPQWAYGPATYFAEQSLSVPANPPFNSVNLTFTDWLINGSRRNWPLTSITVDVRGHTNVCPSYQPQLTEVVVGSVKYIPRSVTFFDETGTPMAAVEKRPVYARISYDEYRLLQWAILDNRSSTWLKVGERALLTAPESAVDGYTRRFFVGWSDGVRERTRLVGPGNYTALYKTQHYVVFKATNYTRGEWVDEYAKIQPLLPKGYKVYDDGNVRIYVNEWRFENGTAAEFPYTVTSPANFTAVETKEYRVRIVDWDTVREEWLPDGTPLNTEPRRKWLLWQFAGWQPAPVVVGPGEYRAVYQIDAIALSALVLVVVAAAAGTIIWRRR